MVITRFDPSCYYVLLKMKEKLSSRHFNSDDDVSAAVGVFSPAVLNFKSPETEKPHKLLTANFLDMQVT